MRLIKERRRRRTLFEDGAKWIKGVRIILSDGIECIKEHRTTSNDGDNGIKGHRSMLKGGVEWIKRRRAAIDNGVKWAKRRQTVIDDGVNRTNEHWTSLSNGVMGIKERFAASDGGVKGFKDQLALSGNKAKKIAEYRAVLDENVKKINEHRVELHIGAKRLKEWYARQAVASRICIGAVAYFVLFFSAIAIFVGNACGVYVNGQQIAVAADENLAQKAFSEVVKDKSDKAGVALAVNDEVVFRGVHARKEAISNTEDLKKSLNSVLSFNTNGVLLTIDGEKRICLNDKEEAEGLLVWLKSLYPPEDGETVKFKEQVELVETVVNEKDLTSLEEARDMLLYGSDKVEQYVVKSGDTAWDIAAKYDMFPDSLQVSNPGVDLWHINIGQVLKLSREVPLITVASTREYTTDETIPYKVEERQDDKLMPGEKRVITAGTAGLRTVTYRVTRENGFEIDREELEQEVLREPSTEVVARGSQIMLASRGGGRIGWPGGGKVISAFGMRGGRMHKGVDISGGTGAPVVAAAAGTVIYTASGYDGGYGNNIEISHGNGYVTKYAHLSSINVHVGQTVQRGEFIGRVGATGNAVGPHLHFEVRVNGVQQNPSNYF